METNGTSSNAEPQPQQYLSADEIRFVAAEVDAVRVASEQVRQSLDTILQCQSQADTALVDAKAKLVDITNATASALEAKTQIVASQSVIAAKSNHIEDAKVHADNVRADLDRALVAATKSATDA